VAAACGYANSGYREAEAPGHVTQLHRGVTVGPKERGAVSSSFKDKLDTKIEFVTKCE
jgi:hypothetical protein